MNKPDEPETGNLIEGGKNSGPSHKKIIGRSRRGEGGVNNPVPQSEFGGRVGKIRSDDIAPRIKNFSLDKSFGEDIFVG